MKNINTKKVIAGAAALAVGASFLGAAVAAQVDFGSPVVKGDVIGTSGMPTATVIVGTQAQPADVIWAGNIAAAIASKAYTEETHTIEIEGTPATEGTAQTVIADGKLFDTETLTTLDAGKSYQLRYTNYTGLTREDVEYDIAGTTTTLSNVEDQIDVIFSKVYFESNDKTRSIIGTINQEGIVYTLNLRNGIPSNLATGGDHDVYIPFLNQEYKVRKSSTTEVELVLQENTIIYNIGDTFSVTGKGSFANSNLTIEVGTITQTPNVVLKLMDGSTVIATKVVRDGRTENFGGKIEDISVSVNYADNQTSFVEISIGTDVLTLKDGDVVSKLTKNGVEWKADIIENAGKITSIRLLNNTPFDGTYLDTDDYPALTPGDKIDMPGSLGLIDFIGLKDESMYDWKTNNGFVEWTSKDNDVHKIPMYENNAKSGYRKITIDGLDYYFHYQNSAITVRETSDVNGPIVEGYIYQDTDATATVDATYDLVDLEDIPINDFVLADNGDTSFIGIKSDLRSSVVHYYAIVEHESGRWALALSGKVADSAAAIGAIDAGDLNTTPYYYLSDASTGWLFSGTDDAADGDLADAADHAFFTGMVDKETDVSVFTIVDGTSQSVKGYFDPYSKRLIATDKYTNYTKKALYSSNGLNDLSFDDYASEDLREGITYRGSEVKISSGNLMINQPDKERTFKIAIGGGVTTTTTGGTEGTAGSTQTYTTYTPANIDAMNLVKMDTASVAGTKIVVGGHIVNTLAQGVTNDYLAQAGQWVMGKDTAGNIIVAGFTADDTGAATRAFIQAIQ